MNPIPQISREELITRLAQKDPPLVIDVLPEEEFRCAHLPGAKNACVYNVTFLEDVSTLVSDYTRPLVLYGSSIRNLASTTAAEKLVANGYTAVADYRGGVEDWRHAGQPLEGIPAAAKREMDLHDGTHQIDVENSRVEWTGRNLTGAHSGTIKLREGTIEIVGGRPVRGSFTLDMHSIANADIEDGDLRRMLVNHLKSDDFFDVQHFPDAEFRLTRVSPLPDAKPGNPNFDVSGELMIKGIRRDITFRAILAETSEGLLAADGHLDIDRTHWNVLYGSGKFYEKLGKHLVHDEVSLGLKLVTLRSRQESSPA
jgi:polyisoprenoid-binding protein YceI